MWNKLSTGKVPSKPEIKDCPYFLKDLIPTRNRTTEFLFLTTFLTAANSQTKYTSSYRFLSSSLEI